MARRSRRELRDNLYRVAETQAGWFTAKQALESGYTYPAQAYHASQGNWIRMDRGIYRLNAWPATDREDLVRWTLWSRERGVISHATATSMHGLGDLNPAQIHMTVPKGFRASASGVVLHRGVLPDADVERHAGYRITTPLRSILDVAALGIEEERLIAVISDALRRGVTTRKQLRERADIVGPAAALRIERCVERAGA